MNPEIYAHSLKGRPKEEWQTLAEHHERVAKQAAEFAAPWAPLTGGLLGRIHDQGKNSDSFQRRLEGKAAKVDHTSAAYQYLEQQWQNKEDPSGELLARLLAYPLLGHHGGLANFGSQAESGTLAWRLSGARIRAVPDWKPERARKLDPVDGYFQELAPLMNIPRQGTDAFAAAFMLRMLYSCLVDADYLDTERFCAPEKHSLRPAWPALEALADGFFQHLEKKNFLRREKVAESVLEQAAQTACGTEDRQKAIASARAYMLQRCMAQAENKPGFFSLTMPTGGGKTLSSLAFALKHARAYGLRRIVLVVPYTSIIEQNADVWREALGGDVLLEHHSNFVHPEVDKADSKDESAESASLAYRLTTENWDASVIVTTSVQFFESLFANQPSRCRKLHNLARSVIILDEAQMLPVPFVEPCLAALHELVRNYGSTVVLCTATQPALMEKDFLNSGLTPEEVREIIPASAVDSLHDIFKRVEVEIQPEPLDDETLAQSIRAEPQVLCIVNSRRQARELFALLEGGEADFHLSARMTPEHRKKTLETIGQRLAAGLSCRVVSTSLIECGVDISFPVVMREKNGLDVLAQSAGRCNREGKDACGRVVCFTSARPVPRNAGELNRRRTAFDQLALAEDLCAPETVKGYFEALYKTSYLDEEGILKLTEICQQDKDSFWKFQFAEIARKFRFIDEDTVSVVIEQGEAVGLLREAEESGALKPSDLRKLQPHCVQVYRSELARMENDGRIETRCGYLHVLSGGTGYSEKTGLDVSLEKGLPVEDLLF